MHFRWINARLAPTVLLACGAILSVKQPVQAQQTPPPGGTPGGMHRWGGHRPNFDPVIVEGPPAPDSMARLVKLDENAGQRYATLYENLMAATRTERDSLSALRQARRAEMEQGGPGQRHGMGAGAGLREDLEHRQQQFDKALEDFFSKDQLKQYRDWREGRRKEARERMRPSS